MHMEGDLMGCDGFFVDRRDLECRSSQAYVMRAHWATVENGKRLMALWDIAARGSMFDWFDNKDWKDLAKLADVAMILGDVVLADLSAVKDCNYEFPLTTEDLMDQSDYRFMIVLDWNTKSVQEYSMDEIEEIFYKEDEQ